MMKTLTILLAASAILAPTSIAAHLASNPSDPREDAINGAKKNVHRRRRLRNKSSKSIKKGSDHSNDIKENTTQEEEITEVTFNKYGSPGEGTDNVMTMDNDFSMPAVDGFMLLIDDAELGLGLELPSEFGRMSMPLDALETAPIALNGMSMDFPAMSMDFPAMSMDFPAMSMEFTEPPFSADRENGSTTAATMAASSGGTLTTTKASKALMILPPSPSGTTMTTSTVPSIEEEEPEDKITIVGELSPSSSSMKSPILIASVVVGALFMMW